MKNIILGIIIMTVIICIVAFANYDNGFNIGFDNGLGLGSRYMIEQNIMALEECLNLRPKTSVEANGFYRPVRTEFVYYHEVGQGLEKFAEFSCADLVKINKVK